MYRSARATAKLQDAGGRYATVDHSSDHCTVERRCAKPSQVRIELPHQPEPDDGRIGQIKLRAYVAQHRQRV
ncbi:hypothetical protein CBM2599_B140193 [Cupriavidus taiwanensis]|uniref:Uncharacterized protein n=1 Tax=Cupriavidus taiwanensis TaxID=164546 RepID=A0A976FYT9_9BURK|nr:hypothetical protein CBM2599_B140193 [Cupriavidus taiwanensis]SOY99427.1 hypothetical protein CBM2600_B60169 [Cupriavidus taiwanensis]SPD67321.1 protein of unknown function [Cupriavidus taiwanensis]